jgi:H/ACA ribonucleoprotein complex subunit 4
VLEQKERLLLTRILCEAGTYIRKLYYDIGEILGPGATMIELRRTRVDQFYEADGLVTLHELANAFALWEENKDDSKLMKMIKPVEYAFSELRSVIIRDSAVDAMCHGAQLAIPGILKISPNLRKGDIVGIYTQKGEAVALAESTMSEEEIRDATKGYAFETRRIIMAPNTYPKKWRTKPSPPKD